MALKIFILLLATVAAVSSAGLLETLLSWDLSESEGRSTTPQSKCLCQTSGCLCCVDLNLTSTIDLGGPACMNIKQKEANVTLNLSYADNPVHNATIKIADAANKPTCMNLLSDLAQICAKFVSLKPGDAGYDGCLVIEPALLGSPQATYHMGCFNFNNGVRQIEVAITETTEPADNSSEDDDGLNADELIAAVSAGAEHGIALFSQWLGINLSPKSNQSSKAEKDEAQQETRDPTNVTSARSARNMLSYFEPEQDKNEERFKQLLSAQDNIMKESFPIGRRDGMRTTFVYSQPDIVVQEAPEAKDEATISPENLAVVPRDSRRGGRAYNIHQHVNEV